MKLSTSEFNLITQGVHFIAYPAVSNKSLSCTVFYQQINMLYFIHALVLWAVSVEEALITFNIHRSVYR